MATAELVGGLDVAPGTEGAEWRILKEILEGDWACRPVSALLRAGGRGVPRGTAARAFEELTKSEEPKDGRPGTVRRPWLVTWTPQNGKPVATLSPWAAEQLDVALIAPEDDGPGCSADPRWGSAGLAPSTGHLDKVGRYAAEPDCFVIEMDWGDMKRSRTRLEKMSDYYLAKRRRERLVLKGEVVLDEESGEPLLIFGCPVFRDRRIKAAWPGQKDPKAGAKTGAAKAARERAKSA